MSGRTKGSQKNQEQKLLEEGYVPIHNYNKATKRKSFSAIFIFTFCIGVAMLILFASSFNNESKISAADKIANFIVSKEFMDLSIDKENNKSENNDIYSGILDIIDGIVIPSSTQANTEATPPMSSPLTPENLYDFDYDKVPIGQTPIVPMNLALSSYGADYFHNDTAKSADAKAMLSSDLDLMIPTQAYPQSAPLVLIVHTHGTESYSENGAISFYDDGKDLARSENENENVVALGNVIAEILNDRGINTIHCTIMHDKLQYKDAYNRAEETIKEYLKKYPSIKMVIDVHRDSILKSTGELVRPVTEIDGKAAAQMMFVVGGSDSCVYWQQNLTLALKLREALNSEYNDLCRPPYLKSSTYNQDLVPYSILLEAGASGNSIEEATLSARLFADALVSFFGKI